MTGMDTGCISPYLLYQHAGPAMDWLIDALGFEERERVTAEDGVVMHGELTLGNGVVMLGCGGPNYEGPATRNYRNGFVHIYIDDVDAHHAHAKAKGAKILSEPEDQLYGDRRYECEDPEGQRWFFAQMRSGG